MEKDISHQVQCKMQQINQDYQPSQVQPCLKVLEQTKSVMSLVNSFRDKLAMKLVEIKKFLKWFGEEQIRRNKYDITFYCCWISIIIYQQIDMKPFKQIQKCFKQMIVFTNNKDLSECIQNISKNYNKELLAQDDLKDIISTIQKDQYYQMLLKVWQEQSKGQQIDPNQTFEEGVRKQLVQMEEDQKDMPQGSYIKIIQRAIIDSLKNKYEFLNKGKKEKIDVEQIKKKLEQNNNYSLSIQKDLEFVQKNQDKPNQVYSALLKIRTELFPIYVPHLYRLIMKNQETKQHVCNKSLILLIGKSGAGKSTIIFKCLGYDLIKGVLTVGGSNLITLEPKGPIKDQHKQIKSSPQQKSITSTVTAVKLAKQLQKGKYEILIADTPGLQDSGGFQIDLANGIGIINAIRNCWSIRPVIVVSQQSWGDRSQIVKELGKTVTGLFCDYQSIHNSITWIFNKFTQQQIQNLPGKCKNIEDTLTQPQKGDNQLMAFVKDLQNEVSDLNKITIFKPFASKQQFKKDLIQKILKRQQINSPSKQFRYNFTQKTKQALNSVCQMYQNLILKKFLLKNYNQTNYYLKNLKILNDKITNTCAQKSYQKTCQQLNQIINKIKGKLSNQLRFKVMNNCANKKTYQEIINQKQKLHQMRIFQNYLIIPKQYQIEGMFKEVQSDFISKIQKDTGTNLIDTLKGAKLYQQHFNKRTFQQNINNILNERKVKIQKSMKQIIQSQEYGKLKSIYQEHMDIQNAQIFVNASMQQAQDYGKYINNLLTKKIQNQISLINRQIPNDLQNITINENDIDKINQVFTLLKKLTILNLPFLQNLAIIQSNLQQKFIDLIRQICYKISTILDQDQKKQVKDNIANRIKKYKQNAIRLAKIESITKYATLQVQGSLSKMRIYMQKSQQSLQQMVRALKKNEINAIGLKILTINKCIQRLQKLSQLENDQKMNKQIQQMIIFVKDGIGRYFKDTFSNYKNYKITFNKKDTDKVLDLIKKFNEINSILGDKRQFGKIHASNIQQIRENIKNILLKPIQEMEVEINKNLTYKDIQLKIEKLNNFVDFITSLNFQSQSNDIEQIKDKLQLSIKISCKQILQRAKNQRDQLITTIIDNNNSNKQLDPIQVKKLKQYINFYRKLINYQSICTYIFEDDYQNQKQLIQQIIVKIKQMKQYYEQYCSQNKFKSCGKKFIQILIRNCSIIKQFDSQLQSNQKIVTFKQILNKLQKFISQDFNQCKKIALQAIQLQKFQIDFPTLINQWVQLGQGKHAQSQAFRSQVNSKIAKLQKKLMDELAKVSEQLTDNMNSKNQSKANNLFIKSSTLRQKILDLTQSNHLKIDLHITQQCITESQSYLRNVLIQYYSEIKQKIQKFQRKGVKEKIDEFIIVQRTILKSKNKKLLEQLQAPQSFVKSKLSEQEAKKKKSEQLKILLTKKQQEIFKNYLPDNFLNIKFDNGLNIVYDQFFIEEKEKFKEHVQQYFQSQLKIYKEDFFINQSEAQAKLKSIQSKILYLPAKLKKQIQQNVRKVVQNNKLQIKLMIESIRKTQIKSLSQIIKNIKNNNKNKQLNQFWRIVYKQYLQNTIKQIQVQIDIVEKFRLWEIKLLIIDEEDNQTISQIQQLKNQYQNTQVKIIRYFESIFDRKIRQLKHQTKNKEPLKAITTDSETVGNITKDLMTIGSKIKQFKKNFQNPQITKQINNKFNDFINKSAKNYREIVEALDPYKLDNNLYNYQIISQINNKTCQILTVQSIFIQIKSTLDLYDKQFFSDIQQQTINSFKILPQKKQILQKLQNKISIMIKQIQRLQIYNDQMKNYVDQNFKQYANKLNNNLQKLQNLQKTYQYNLIHPHQFQYKNLIINIQLSIQKILEDCQNQINKACKQYDLQISPKPNTVLKLLTAFKQEGVKDIKYQQQVKMIPNIIQKNVQNIKKESQKQIQQLKKLKDQTKKQQEKQKAQFQTYCNSIKQQIQPQRQQKIKKKIQQAQTQIDTVEGNNNQQKNRKIQQIQKKRDMEIQSIKKDINNILEQKIQQKKKIYTKLLQKNKLQRKQILQKLAKQFIIIKKISVDLQHSSNQNKKILDKLTNNFQEKVQKRVVRQMEEIIKQLPQPYYAQILVNQNKTFKASVASQWKDDVEGKDIHYVLNNLKLDPKQAKKILSSYEIYQKHFNKEIDTYSKEPDDSTINSLVIRTINLGAQLQKYYQGKIPPTSGEKEQLLACIFALWAILKSEKNQSSVQYLYKPHPVQIVTQFLILGINNQSREEKLANRMAQVGTGQGKSVVLAGLSVYFSLVGYQVHCACYSEYLSGRDQQAFATLFERLSVTSKIKYGTFNEQCWDLLNSVSSSSQTHNLKFSQLIQQALLKDQSFWQQIKQFFGGNFLNSRQGGITKKALIIDEVDVFFDRSFYGNILPSCISLNGPQVKNVLEMVWKKVKAGQRVRVSQITNSQDFKLLVNKFKPLKQVLKGQIHGMIAGALNYQHSYIIHDYRIAYKDQDSISTTMNYGYKTVFANCYEYDKKTISQAAYLEAMEIGLTVAQFSYALLPIYFDKIVGVTGTLFDIGEFYQNQLKERYKVENQYRMPSIYGEKRRIQQTKIVPPNKFYSEIVNDIEEKVKNSRPTICFFRNISDMVDFYHSKQMIPYKSNVNTLSEQNEAYSRDLRIKQAVKAGQITLMTAAFGRGTDFKLYDKTIVQKGGLHIIQCYLSIQLAEEIQVKGRSARQGKKGSYTLLIPENQFGKIGFENFKIGMNIKQHVEKNRKLKMDQVVKDILNDLKSAEQKHQKTINLFKAINLVRQDIVEFVNQINKYPQVVYNSVKVILGIDATGSMGGAIANVKSVLQQTFDRVYDILRSMGDRGSFDLQIAVYRNWNSPANQVLQYSAFQNQVGNLKQFIRKVTAHDGYIWRQSLQVLYQHANRQEKIDQIIMIGDAPANQLEQMKQVRSIRGEAYWIANNFPYTTQAIQLQKIIEKKIPIHSFYIAAEEYFKDLSKKTGGISQIFNVNSANSAEILTQFIAQNILNKLGGQKGKAYVDEYRKKYRPT